MSALFSLLPLFFALVVPTDYEARIVYDTAECLEMGVVVGEGDAMPAPPAKGDWILDGVDLGDVSSIFTVSFQDTSSPSSSATVVGSVWKVVITPPNGGDPVTAFFRQDTRPVVPTKGWWRPGKVFTQAEPKKGTAREWILFDQKIVMVNMSNAFAIQINRINA